MSSAEGMTDSIGAINPLMHKVQNGNVEWNDVKIKNHGLGQYVAKPHYSTLPFWQLWALNG